jgi:Ser/Thr protein kinase RdoA (MazF antagonist)
MTAVSAIPALLAQFGVAPQHRLEPIRENAGFSGAQVWRVIDDCGAWAMRATPESAVILDRVRGLHRLIHALRRREFTLLPCPERNPAGESLLLAAGFAWQLEPWMPGTADFHAVPHRTRLVAVMHALAIFHRAAAEFEPVGEERQWFFIDRGPSPGLTERLRHLQRWDQRLRDTARASLATLDWPEFRVLGLEVLRRFEQRAASIATLLAPFRDIDLPLQPCLRDIWHDHLLFTGERLTGLIDPHACRSDCVATDLARCLGSLLGDNPAEWDFALQAYQEIRPLSLDERASVEVFDRSAVLLNGLTWLEWVCLRGRVFPVRERVIARMRDIVERLERLV